MTMALAFARAAQDLTGTPFRLHGRDRATGLDCIGVVVASLAAMGCTPPTLPPYAMRNRELARFFRLLEPAGFAACSGPSVAGDLLLLQPSAAQFHLAVVSPSGALIHAHGGLGRVVASPAPLPWPQVGHWRLRTT